jgi:hypothetical protein
MTNRTMSGFAAVTAVLALLVMSCSEKAADGDANGPVEAGTVTDVSGCKTFESGSTRSFATPTQSCIQYEYDGASVLRITHVNAGFNCCPDSLGVSVHAVDGNITIQEMEWLLSGGCHCLCLFDMTYEVPFVEPGEYTLKFNEPYVLADDNELKFTVDLVTAPTGSICVDRDRYPWGNP